MNNAVIQNRIAEAIFIGLDYVFKLGKGLENECYLVIPISLFLVLLNSSEKNL